MSNYERVRYPESPHSRDNIKYSKLVEQNWYNSNSHFLFEKKKVFSSLFCKTVEVFIAQRHNRCRFDFNSPNSQGRVNYIYILNRLDRENGYNDTLFPAFGDLGRGIF